MIPGTALRAVVFEVEDLPAGDRRHILDVASCLRLPLDDCFRTPLVLTSAAAPPPAPGLRDDAALADGGPSLLLLAMRLILADAYHWPEQGWLALGAPGGAAGYTLYAANPLLWTSDTLSAALAARGPVQRGLLQRDGRPPVAAGDRVPLLGFAVPVIGGKGPVRDLRPADQRPYRFGGVAVPLGMTPAGATGRHGLFFRVHGARYDGEQVDADLEIALLDGALGRSRTWQLSLTLAEPPADVAAEEDLGEWLRELLPGCLLCSQQGEPLLLDLYRLGLRSSCAALRVLQVAPVPPDADDGPEILDPMLWEPAVLAGLLQESETQVSADGRLVSLRFTGLRDGMPVDTYVVLAGSSAPGEGPLRPVAWSADLGGTSPSVALGEGGTLALASRRLAAAAEGPLWAGCLAEADAEAAGGRAADLLWLRVRPEGTAQRPLLLVGAAALPQGLAAPSPPALYFIDSAQRSGAPSIDGGRALLCHQGSSGIFCTVDLTVSELRPRPTTRADLRSAILGGGEALLRRFLRALAAADPTDDEVPALGFLGPVSDFARATAGPLDVAALLQAPAAEVATVLLKRFLGSGGQRTFTEAGLRAIE